MRAVVCNITLDCPRPAADLASFYAELLGLRGHGPVYDDWAVVCQLPGLRPHLAFAGVEDYRAPRWPDPAYPQQGHFDLIVDDIDAAERFVLQQGGTKLADAELVSVYADPVGHPICLSEDHWDTFNRASDRSLGALSVDEGSRTVVCNYVLTCPDPVDLASFYADLLGLRRVSAYGECIELAVGPGSHPYLVLMGVEDYRPPQWPDPAHPQQVHLDLVVDDLRAAEKLVVLLGGEKLADKGDVYPIDIYADPVGHPFCMMEGSP